MIKFCEQPDIFGAFTKQQAPEAKHKNGSRVEKAMYEKGDATPLGTKGTVLGSIYMPGKQYGAAYFVTWDNRPNYAVLVVEWKIKTIDSAPAKGVPGND
jgi:hypothetical protein